MTKEIITAPVLSVHQPWASAIVFAGKCVENRTYPVGYRGPVLIHATMKPEYDQGMEDLLMTFKVGNSNLWTLIGSANKHYPWLTGKPGFHFGAIIGVARLRTVDYPRAREYATPNELLWWEEGCFGWLLDDARPIVPIPWKGSQGFRTCHPATVEVEYLERKEATP